MKRAVKIGLIVLAVLLAAVIAYVAYVFIDYHRLPDRQPLAVEQNTAAQAQTDTEYEIVSFNIGFGAYEPDYGFFMDGGTQSWAWSKERLEQNLTAIGDWLTNRSPDLLLLQEVDEKGTRTYRVNERQLLTDRLSDRAAVWAQNWDSPFLMYPLAQPHGANRSGLLTFSRFTVDSALRRSLPIENSLRRLVDLDRCYSVSRIPVADGHTLVLYDVHLSAYTSDGTVAVRQLEQLIADMRAEYEAGNYVLCGGDFNKNLLGDDAAAFGAAGASEEYTWAQPFPTELLDGTGLSLCAPLDRSNPVPSCRNADSAWHEGQYVVTVDGFIVSDNIAVESAEVVDTGFAYSDHNPVSLRFRLHAGQ